MVVYIRQLIQCDKLLGVFLKTTLSTIAPWNSDAFVNRSHVTIKGTRSSETFRAYRADVGSCPSMDP
jgi:hypothetical protein